MRFPEISGWIFQNFKNYKKILSELRDPALGSWVPCQLRIQGVQKEQKITYPHVRRSKGTVDVANLSKIIPQVTPIGFLCLWVSLNIQKVVIHEPGPKPGPQVPVVGPGWVLQDGALYGYLDVANMPQIILQIPLTDSIHFGVSQSTQRLGIFSAQIWNRDLRSRIWSRFDIVR